MRVKAHWPRMAVMVALPVAIAARSPPESGRGTAATVLIECLTLWLSNLVAEKRDWREAAKHLSERLAIAPRPVVLVTNELGMGLVPALPRSRLFREAAGALNQTIACACTEIWLVVAGVPTRLGAASGCHQPR